MIHKLNLDDLDWVEMSHGERFHHQRKTLTPFEQVPAPKVGISLYRLEPGKRAFPFHEHMGNDEAILVTGGEGTLRYGNDEIPMATGDYVHLPAASGRAHQMINTSDGPLEYLCLSSLVLPEVVRYPDSNKLGAISPGDSGVRDRRAAFLFEEPVNYWDGEEAQ